MNTLNLELVESEAKIILDALSEMELKMAELCENSSDEDQVAEIGNDLIELRLLLNPMKEKATMIFGQGVLNFSRELL